MLNDSSRKQKRLLNMSFILRTLTRARPRSQELIGPPDPISNIRPIAFKGQSSPPSATAHPYSLAEFGGTEEDSIDFQWRLERERLNAFNHAFWLDVSFFFGPTLHFSL